MLESADGAGTTNRACPPKFALAAGVAMPTIIAICPYCRAGGVRAPDTALGASATCPKCKSNFTVVPSDDIPPGWDKPRENPKPAPVPIDETRATAAMPDKTEPSPVLPSVPAPAKPHTTATAPQVSEPPPPPDMGMVFALLALILVGPAVLASQLPYGRFIALPLAAVGLIGGLLSFGAEGKARLAAVGAAVLHFLLLIVVLLLPSWLNLDPWRGPATVEEQPKGPMMVEHASGTLTPLPAGQWLDASKHSWQLRDTRISVRSAVGPVELTHANGAKWTTKERYLHLVLQVRNVGFDREIPLSGWAAGQGTDGVRVTDANGKQLEPAKLEAGWTYDRGKPNIRATPGYTSEVHLLFTAPPAKTEYVRVELSGTAVGVQEPIQFRTGTTGFLPSTVGK